MAAHTTGGALKAFLEAAGLGLSWYRDGAPESVTPPYGTVLDEVGASSIRPAGLTLEMVQVDLWQPSRRTLPDGRLVSGEVYDLSERVDGLLSGRGLEPYLPWHLYGTRLTRRRTPPRDNVIRHTWTLTLTRSTTRKAAA